VGAGSEGRAPCAPELDERGNMAKQLPIDRLECDMELQPRAKLSRGRIEDYARDMAAGARFPPVVAFYDGDRYWLADGFHRRQAAEMARLSKISVDAREGGRRDALLHSLGANAKHGFRRSNADKQRAVDIMLNDPGWSGWSDSQIARQISVDHKTVANRRGLILGNSQDEHRRVSRSGSTYQMHISKIGRAPKIRETAEVPLPPAAQVVWLPDARQRHLVDEVKAVPRDVEEPPVCGASAIELRTEARSSISPGTKRYSVVYADPWHATTTLDELCAEPVPAADDSVLFLRVPVPMLPDGLRLMESLGFKYKEHLVWNKGYSERGCCGHIQHEVLLIGARGNMPMPKPGTEQPSIFSAAGCDDIAHNITGMFPDLPKAKLFTQTAPAGWDAWRPQSD
jgi:N6-adenosine-specific RNA methylase IME4